MSDTQRHNDSLESFLQAHTATPSLSDEAKERMLGAGTKTLRHVPKNSDDYTWPQFFLRFTAMLAACLICTFFIDILTFNQDATENRLVESLPSEIERQHEYLPALAIASQQKAWTPTGYRWIDYQRKGQLP